MFVTVLSVPGFHVTVPPVPVLSVPNVKLPESPGSRSFAKASGSHFREVHKVKFIKISFCI